MKNTSLILSIVSLVAVVVFGILLLTKDGSSKAEVSVAGESTEVAAKGDIVYIDLDRILMEYDMANDLRSVVQTKVENIQAEINRRGQKLQNEVNSFQENNEDRNANRSVGKDNKPLINEKIRAKEVRLIDENGNNHGVVPTTQALRMAEEAELDLVVISPNQAPPVAKILNYGKYKYELEKKAKEAKKKQKTVEIKEIKVRYKIDTHDYEVRLKNIRKFISQGNKVKIIVMLRGREMQHSNLAVELADKFIADLANDPIVVEKKPMVEGRNVTAWLAPSSN